MVTGYPARIAAHRTATCYLLAVALVLAIGCQHAAWQPGASSDSMAAASTAVAVQMALTQADGRALENSAVVPGSRVRLQATAVNVGQKGVFLRTDAGTGPFADVEWVAADGSRVGWIPPADEANAPTGNAWARYRYLTGTDEAGVAVGLARDDQVARMVKDIRIPEEATSAQSILVTVSLDLEYATAGSEGFTRRREARRFRLSIAPVPVSPFVEAGP